MTAFVGAGDAVGLSVMDGTCEGVLVGIMGDKGFDVGGGSGVLIAVGKGAGAQLARPTKSMESRLYPKVC